MNELELALFVYRKGTEDRIMALDDENVYLKCQIGHFESYKYHKRLIGEYNASSMHDVEVLSVSLPYLQKGYEHIIPQAYQIVEDKSLLVNACTKFFGAHHFRGGAAFVPFSKEDMEELYQVNLEEGRPKWVPPIHLTPYFFDLVEARLSVNSLIGLKVLTLFFICTHVCPILLFYIFVIFVTALSCFCYLLEGAPRNVQFRLCDVANSCSPLLGIMMSACRTVSSDLRANLKLIQLLVTIVVRFSGSVALKHYSLGVRGINLLPTLHDNPSYPFWVEEGKGWTPLLHLFWQLLPALRVSPFAVTMSDSQDALFLRRGHVTSRKEVLSLFP